MTMRTTISNKLTTLYTIIFTSVILSNCQQSRPASQYQASIKSFAARFNEKYENNDLLLSCITYAVEKTKGLKTDSVKGFYEINSQLKAYSPYPASENADSSLEAFIAANKAVDFTSGEAQNRIELFKNSLYLVGSIIEGGISDDSDEENMKLLEEKIDKIPEIAKIYRSYVAKDRGPGSLSSGEGSSLLIHLAYYFSMQDPHKRNELLKRLL